MGPTEPSWFHVSCPHFNPPLVISAVRQALPLPQNSNGRSIGTAPNSLFELRSFSFIAASIPDRPTPDLKNSDRTHALAGLSRAGQAVEKERASHRQGMVGG